MNAFEPTAVSVELGHPQSSLEVVSKVFSVLDAAGIKWCLSHGYEPLLSSVGSDVDIIVERSVSSTDLVTLFTLTAAEVGARIVRASEFFIVLNWESPLGVPHFLALDFSHDVIFKNYLLARGEDILAARVPFRQLWIPSLYQSLDIDFTRSVLKRGKGSGVWLCLLHRIRTVASSEQIFARYIRKSDMLKIYETSSQEGFEDFLCCLDGMRKWLKLSLFLQSPRHSIQSYFRNGIGRAKRVLNPPGLHVALLGPDGAGKSTAITGLEQNLSPLFSATEIQGFAPSPRDLLGSGIKDTSTPHALSARSYPVSLVRAAYWLTYALASHFSLRWKKAKNLLILNDRHFMDILVDPARYRYGGPTWALRLIKKIAPQPDLIILLNGSPGAIQARKKELTVEETARQCEAYRSLVCSIDCGRMVDAMQSPAEVVVRISKLAVAEWGRKFVGS